jgi:transcriptional regulator with XRE-family HTH domain
MNIGKAIKLCRTQRGLTQSEVSDAADISVSYLSLVERGKRDPNWSTVQSVAAALDIPVSMLVFLATDNKEISKINPDLVARLSEMALQLMKAPEDA